ncbi:MAG: tetratricopeptide repeat protein [Myxococcales bacterium]|nr:tetratricopeptide repeat protein [Myxococcales bacterium]
MKRRLSSVLVVALATLLVTALAGEGTGEAAPKYKRENPKLSIDVKKTDRTKGLERKKGQKPEESKPQLSADDFIQIQGEVKNIRNAQIQIYKQLIDDTDPKSKEMPELLFRLAEAYAKKQRYWRFRAMEMYTKLDKAKKGAKAKLQKKQKLYFDTEKKALVQAMKVYSDLANEPRYKNYPKMDEVLFYYGYTLDGAKRITESRKIFHQLIKNYPDSKYIPQAFLSFADYFFQKNDLDNAEKFYDKVLQFPNSSIYPYGLYKKGWVYLNQERPQDALETFFKVVNITKGKERSKTINKAAKKDFVRAYAAVGRAEKAYQAFQRVDKGYAFNMLSILGGIYLDQGAAEKAIFTYRELIGIKSKDPTVCEWQGNVLNAMLSAGNQKQKSDEIVNLVKIYLSHKEQGILKGGKLEECRDNAQGTTSEMAKTWHNEAIKTLNPEALGSVEQLYKLYVKSFPNSSDIGDMQYYYAELLWQRAENEKNPRMATDRWERAAMAFTDVVQGGKVKGKLLKESAYAAVLGWKNALAVDPRTKTPTTELDEDAENAKIPEPKPIGEREQKMIAAFDIYIKYIKDPTDDELVMMKFLKARIYWRHDRLEESLPLFLDIVEDHSSHESALYSANIAIDSLIRLKQYDVMNKTVIKMLKDTKFLEDKEELKERLLRIKGVAMRKAAEQLEKEGKHIACGQAYLDIYNANPTGDGMDEVLYSAGVCFEDGKSIGLAIRMYGTLDKKHPDSEHNQKALVRMGSAYGSIAHYEKAAEKYEQYATRYGGEKDAPNALQNAVTYRKGIGQDKEAIADIEKFVETYKKKLKDESAAAMFGLAGIYEKQGNNDMVVRAYRRYIREIGKSGGLDRLLIANAKIGEILWNQSCKSGGQDGACVRMKRERAIRKRGKKKKRRGLDLPTQCGEESKIKMTVLDRDRRLVKASQKHFRAALKNHKKAINSAPDKGRKAGTIYWMAASKFYLAGESYEKFLALKFPTKLDFSKRNAKKKKDSDKRFLSWFTDKQKAAGELIKSYGVVRDIKGGGAAWAVAAAARVGQTSQNFSDGLFTAEIPKDVRTGQFAEDSVAVYCDALTTKAAPLEDLSVGAFGFCLNLSTKLNWFNDWSRLCEKELGQIRPADFPTATEFHGVPDGAADITDTQNLITTIAQ